MTAGERLGAAYRLAPNFTLGEFSGWWLAETEQLEKLQLLVDTILQPIRNRFGPVRVTSWLRPGTAAHGTGGAVDFVPGAHPLPVVFQWARAQPLDVGEFIDERDHLHATLPGIGGRGQWLIEPVEGVYIAPGDPPGASWRPPTEWYELPGIDVTVSRFPGWVVAATALVVLLALDDSRRNSRVAR